MRDFSKDNTTRTTDLVPRNRLEAICAFRDQALAQMEEATRAFETAYTLTERAQATAQRAHGGSRFYTGSSDSPLDQMDRGRYDAGKALASFRRGLDRDIWQHLIDSAGLTDLMDKTAKEAFRVSLLGDAPEATLENITATIQQLVGDADILFQRGLATAFSKLDARFRSHDAFKIGSRMILTRVFDDWGSWNYSTGHEATLADVERVFAVLDGNKPNFGALKHAIDLSRGRGIDPRQSECHSAYFRIRGFKNGNAHIWFTRDDLVEKANRLLADYYGATLADAAPKDVEPESLGRRSNVPAKDLQFYATPSDAVAFLLDDFHIRQGARVLEPSAGEGAIASAAIAKGARVDCVEIHPARAATLKEIGADAVMIRNFLTMTPAAIYDAVLMNPPFCGTHWMDHVRHAFAFLKPGGRLRAILPASAEVAETKKHLAFRRWAEQHARHWGWQWRRMPAESFASVGTRINTVVLELQAKGE